MRTEPVALLGNPEGRKRLALQEREQLAELVVQLEPAGQPELEEQLVPVVQLAEPEALLAEPVEPEPVLLALEHNEPEERMLQEQQGQSAERTVVLQQCELQAVYAVPRPLQLVEPKDRFAVQSSILLQAFPLQAGTEMQLSVCYDPIYHLQCLR